MKLSTLKVLTLSTVFTEAARKAGPAIPRVYLRASSAVVRLFLSLLTDPHPVIPERGTTLSSLNTVRDLVYFLQHWNCATTLAHLLLILREQAREADLSPLAAFVGGSNADDGGTCAVALDQKWVWADMQMEGRVAKEHAHAQVLDPHCLPVAVWQLIPAKYTWALTASWSGEDKNKDRHQPAPHGVGARPSHAEMFGAAVDKFGDGHGKCERECERRPTAPSPEPLAPSETEMAFGRHKVIAWRRSLRAEDGS